MILVTLVTKKWPVACFTINRLKFGKRGCVSEEGASVADVSVSSYKASHTHYVYIA